MFNKDASTCISALSQLDEFIKDDEKVPLLSSRMDQLLTACYMQYRHVLNNKMRTDNAASNAKEVRSERNRVNLSLYFLWYTYSL